MSESTTEEKESRQVKAALKAEAVARKALDAAFKAYQKWQVAECLATDQPIDAGNRSTFADWASGK